MLGIGGVADAQHLCVTGCGCDLETRANNRPPRLPASTSNPTSAPPPDTGFDNYTATATTLVRRAGVQCLIGASLPPPKLGRLAR